MSGFTRSCMEFNRAMAQALEKRLPPVLLWPLVGFLLGFLGAAFVFFLLGK